MTKDTPASPYSSHLRKCKQQLIERNVMIDDQQYKYAVAIDAAEREYSDTEGDLTRTIIAALDSDRVNDLPSVDQIEILAWNLYQQYCIDEDIQHPHYGRPVNWEHVSKTTWKNIALRAIQMMEFAR